MRASHVVGYLGLVALGVATFTVTSHAVNNVSRAQAAGRDGRKAAFPVPLYSSFTPSPDEIARRGPDVYATEVVRRGWAAASLEVASLVEVSGGVAIEAAAALSNGIEDQRFVWTLAVLSRDGTKTFLKRRYDHQIGLSRVGTILRPTFRDAVALPPGDYFVSVSIQEVPPAGVKALDDPELAESMTMTGDGQYIIIH